MEIINVTPTIAQMENGGWLIEGGASRADTECPWKHPETCKHCPIKCHLRPGTGEGREG